MTLIINGIATVAKSVPGVVASKEVTVTGMTANGTVVVNAAERDSESDVRGQMGFYAVAGVDKFTIYGESPELYEATNVYWSADINGQSSAVPQVTAGAGAVDIIASVTHIVTDGADAFTLADGTEGQRKIAETQSKASETKDLFR